MKIIKKDKEKIVFIEEIDESLANAIRRSALEIPILAIDEVEIHKNDSALYDEIIAHRLGLIPLENPKAMDLKENCSCSGKGCSKCTVQLKLVAKGPYTVYSKDLKGKVKVVYDKIPIVILKEGQELEAIGFATQGKGIEHAKYSPGLIYYRNLAEIKIKKDTKLKKEIIESCPHGIITEKGVDEKDRYKCDLCEACVEKSKGDIEIIPTKEIIFFVESFGQIKAEEILVEAIKALKSNLKSVEKA